MWETGWREKVWDSLDNNWDLIVIGGGITGAGVLREAGLYGLKTLLLEAHDFSFGTSSRSSKLIHGGFRYLRNRQWDVTRELVREREWLLKAAPYLVERLSFLIPEFTQDPAHRLEFGLGVIIYDLMAPKWQHGRFSRERVVNLVPSIRQAGLSGAHQYYDAEMDDSRLVLRVIREAVAAGGSALNYARVDNLLRRKDGQVCGVVVTDTGSPDFRQKEIRAKAVINAAGPWSDDVRAKVGGKPHLRGCRGSHLVFSSEKFPLATAITLMHPRDDRAMFAFPWEGATLIGTTDLDQEEGWQSGEPYASSDEIEYILEALNATFPGVEVGPEHIVSSFAGIRPLVRSEESTNPSAVSRRHVVWDESGLVTITGGKLTTFRVMARAALQAAAVNLQGKVDFSRPGNIFTPLPSIEPGNELTSATGAYLFGRYGLDTPVLIAAAQAGELEPIENLPNLWAELRWAARCGGAVHLDDILLRRVPPGVVAAAGRHGV